MARDEDVTGFEALDFGQQGVAQLHVRVVHALWYVESALVG
jgi:hypothetical protein